MKINKKEVGIWSEFDGEVTKKLPANTTISKLKLIISRLFSVKANLLSLFFHKKKVFFILKLISYQYYF